MKGFPRWFAIVPLSLALAGGCGSGEGEGTAAEQEGTPSETGAAMDGLTPEQIRRAAESMTPEMAESLGIVDTTIHIEPPFPGDTAPRPDTIRP